MSFPNAAFLELIDLLYSCVDGDATWPTFLTSLAEYLGASLVGVSTNSSLQAVVGADPKELVKYEEYYLRINPWLSGPRSYPEGQVLLTEEVLPVNAYRKTCFYNEWGKKNQVVHAVGGALRVSPASFLFLSINRGDSQDPYGEPERRAVQTLMPHIQRAAHLHERVGTLEQRAWLLDALSYPLLYVTSDGVVRWANQAADDFLRRGHGLRIRNGKLHAELPHENAALRAMLAAGRAALEGVQGYGDWLRITRTDDGSEMSLFLARPPGMMRRVIGIPDAGSGFLVFVASQAIDGSTLATRVRSAWGLTPAEAVLAVELLETENLQAAATKLRVSRNTAKSQLAAIFQKSRTRKQSELVRKLIALAVISPESGERASR